jgi:hypothetical protein
MEFVMMTFERDHQGGTHRGYEQGTEAEQN